LNFHKCWKTFIFLFEVFAWTIQVFFWGKGISISIAISFRVLLISEVVSSCFLRFLYKFWYFSGMYSKKWKKDPLKSILATAHFNPCPGQYTSTYAKDTGQTFSIDIKILCAIPLGERILSNKTSQSYILELLSRSFAL